jgi:hypothetical protein
MVNGAVSGKSANKTIKYIITVKSARPDQNKFKGTVVGIKDFII